MRWLFQNVHEPFFTKHFPESDRLHNLIRWWSTEIYQKTQTDRYGYTISIRPKIVSLPGASNLECLRNAIADFNTANATQIYRDLIYCWKFAGSIKLVRRSLSISLCSPKHRNLLNAGFVFDKIYAPNFSLQP